MKIKLKSDYAQALSADGKIDLPLNRTLEIYRPHNPKDYLEVRHRTEEGMALMSKYHDDKNKWYVAILETKLDPNYELSDVVISPVYVFNTQADAIKSLTEDGIDFGFMPLQTIATKLAGQKSPVLVL